MARNSSGSQGENGRAGDGNAQREPATAKSGNGQAGSGPADPNRRPPGAETDRPTTGAPPPAACAG